jgi:anti-sigma regulatory factor (Ser/Thr protein kinase)
VGETSTRSAIELPGTLQSVREARRHVRTVLGPEYDDVELAVSELVTNAVQHSESGAGRKVRLELAVDRGRVRVDVTDGGSSTGHPRLAEPPELSERGNGLRIVRAISSRWGVEVGARGTTVWCEWSQDLR